MTLRQLLGIDVPVIRAPMAGVQGRALAPYYRELTARRSGPARMRAGAGQYRPES